MMNWSTNGNWITPIDDSKASKLKRRNREEIDKNGWEMEGV